MPISSNFKFEKNKIGEIIFSIEIEHNQRVDSCPFCYTCLGKLGDCKNCLPDLSYFSFSNPQYLRQCRFIYIWRGPNNELELKSGVLNLDDKFNIPSPTTCIGCQYYTLLNAKVMENQNVVTIYDFLFES